MKKFLFLLTVLGLQQAVSAQEPADALRYGWTTPSGTARQLAVGGAMTSLGGDISATFVNPAGLGFYKTGDFVISPGFRNWRNKADYYGRTESDQKGSLTFGTTGIVLGTGETYNQRKKGGMAFSLALNRTASFGNDLLYRGQNNQNSYSQKYLEQIRNDRNPNSVASNYPFGASLAFNTYWIDTIAGGSPGNFSFQSRAPIGNLLQENVITQQGGITELALAFAGNSHDKFYYGFTLGVPFLNYERTTRFTEADASSDVNNKFDFAQLDETLRTNGSGINLKLGAIYKPAEYWRLGLAFHTPSFMRLTDRYNASITTNTENYQGELTQSSGLFTNNQDAEFRYWHFTPWRAMAGLSYVLREVEDVRKQKGFLTADIEYVNYRSASFTTDPEGDQSQETKDYLKSLNQAIDDAYKGAFNFRVGGELKFTTIMTRLGMAYLGNPYKNLGQDEKGHRFQLSGGLGYRHKGVFVDLTYVHTMGRDVHFAYRLENTPFRGAALRQTGGNVLLTLGFKI